MPPELGSRAKAETEFESVLAMKAKFALALGGGGGVGDGLLYPPQAASAKARRKANAEILRDLERVHSFIMASSGGPRNAVAKNVRRGEQFHGRHTPPPRASYELLSLPRVKLNKWPALNRPVGRAMATPGQQA